MVSVAVCFYSLLSVLVFLFASFDCVLVLDTLLVLFALVLYELSSLFLFLSCTSFARISTCSFLSS